MKDLVDKYHSSIIVHTQIVILAMILMMIIMVDKMYIMYKEEINHNILLKLTIILLLIMIILVEILIYGIHQHHLWWNNLKEMFRILISMALLHKIMECGDRKGHHSNNKGNLRWLEILNLLVEEL
jgi:hypothetical protein